MDFIPKDLVMPLLAIDVLFMMIVLFWPDDLHVKVDKPSKKDDDEPPDDLTPT